MKKLLGVVLIMLIGLFLLRNLLAKLAITHGVKAVTGVGVDVGSLDLGLFSSHIGVNGLKVLNPRGFPERVMASLPELFVDYDVGAFLKGKTHLETVRVNLAELVVIKNAQGQVNVNSLTPVRQSEQTKAGAAPKAPAKPPALLIDRLELKVGRVVYKDYSQGATPLVKEFNVNIDERYEHITNPQALGAMILTKALARTTVAQLANIDVGALRGFAEQQLKEAAGGLLNSATTAVGVGTQGAAALKSLFSGATSSNEQSNR